MLSTKETRIKADFENCANATDYEKFILKYNGTARDNEYVVLAKKKLSEDNRSLASQPFYNKPSMGILLGVLCLVACVGCLFLAMAQEGQSQYNVYHGEHIDVKVSNFRPLLGIAGVIGCLAFGIGGLYLIVNSIIIMSKKRAR